MTICDRIKYAKKVDGIKYDINEMIKMVDIGCEYGIMEVINYLDMNGNLFLGHALKTACGIGNKKLVEMMMEKVKENGGIGLIDLGFIMYYACLGGNEEIVSMMIDYGANNWEFGLYGACVGRHKRIAELMLLKGAKMWDASLVGFQFCHYVTGIEISIENECICNIHTVCEKEKEKEKEEIIEMMVTKRRNWERRT